MKKLFKILGWILGIVLVFIIAGIAFLNFTFPKVSPAEELTIEYTPDRVERGAYLANHVAVCMDCHSQRDFSEFSGPPAPGTLGKGGDRFDHGMGFPGVFYAKNITPFGISDYTDGELYRLITTGVTNDGRAMFPLMPYRYYGKMDPEDVYDIIAYVRSIPSIESDIPDSEADFPVSVIIKTIPTDASPEEKPNPSDQLAYGKYMTNVAGCIECHTQVDAQGMVMPDVAFAGGRSFPFPDGSFVTSSNISPDKETGIGSWTEDMFVQRFKQYEDSAYVNPKVPPGEFNTLMPWVMYAGMKEQDLKAIFAYLQSLPSHSNQVTKFTPASGE
ncbi:c-type cytochrome [Algoriphagus zhangzhouensis]|uniref:Cytochrome c n=1 Tax=Algoriphagus zhangzhouensis TaxID=1073327 RepID=A0A1M7ZJD5_9BACT|nr:c-type cytochrome [Algoriphagus zhangzhouensis]TDY43565.1 cytochrome c [Algoriphagus zhangzhouensis]SHO65003.1 Cytochrome c [Algoriphagus zhangzhouensis]